MRKSNSVCLHIIFLLTSHDDHLWDSRHIRVWGLTNSGGWITQLVVGSGCVPSSDTTKWPGPEHKASLTRNFRVLKSRRDKLERSKKYRADLTHHYSSILLPSMWHRGAATLRSPPSNLLEPHVQENISLWIWIGRRDVVTRMDFTEVFGPHRAEKSLATCLWTGQSPLTALAS